jgi:hypothetical protein
VISDALCAKGRRQLPALYLMNYGKLVAGTIGAAALAESGYYGTQYSSSRLEAASTTLFVPGSATDARSREPSRMDAVNPPRPNEARTVSEIPSRTLQRLNILTELQQHKLAKTEIDLFEHVRLSPAFSELFALTRRSANYRAQGFLTSVPGKSHQRACRSAPHIENTARKYCCGV